MSESSDNKLGWGCLLLFAAPFAAVGIGMAGWVCWIFWQWQLAQSWVETPAKILEAKLETHRGEDSDTYLATARYQYTFNGKQYESTRVSLHTGSDNLGSFHDDVVKELKQHLGPNKLFRCFVNPDDPSEALLYRDLRYGLLLFKAIFALIFGGVGIGLVVGAVIGGRKQKAEALRKQQFPDEPWLVREDWAAGLVKSSQRGPLSAAWFFAFIWNSITWMAVGGVLMKGEKIELVLYSFLIGFPLIGLGLLSYAIYLTVRHYRWGVSEFQLASVPGVVGGRLSGVVHLPREVSPEDGFLLTLTNYKKRERETSDGKESYDDPLWQRDRQILRPLESGVRGKTTIPVDFYVPFDRSATDDESGTSWKLSVQADIPGVDYFSEFEVPIFETADSSPDPPADSELLEDYEAPLKFATVLRRSGGRIARETRRELEILFPMGRNPVMAAGVTVAMIVFGIAGIGLWQTDAPWFMAAAFSLVGLGLLAATIWTWFEQVTISCSEAGIQKRGGLLGLGRLQTYAHDDITKIGVKASGSRSGNTVYQQVYLRTTAKKNIALVNGISRRADAQQLASEFRRWLGLEEHDH